MYQYLYSSAAAVILLTEAKAQLLLTKSTLPSRPALTR